jgi:hypothetical protein
MNYINIFSQKSFEHMFYDNVTGSIGNLITGPSFCLLGLFRLFSFQLTWAKRGILNKNFETEVSKLSKILIYTFQIMVLKSHKTGSCSHVSGDTIFSKMD